MPKPGPLARLVGYAKKEPLRVNLLLATLKTVVADLLVQKYLEEREAVDLRRTGALPLPPTSLVARATLFTLDDTILPSLS